MSFSNKQNIYKRSLNLSFMKKALFLTGKLVQDHEFIYPYYRVQEEGFTPVVATIDGKETVTQAGIRVPVDCTIDSINPAEFDLLVIPGGAKCLEYLRQNQQALRIIKEWDAKGKIIASICHGAQMLISAKIVKGRTISGYYSIKDDLENAGATYVDAPFVVDNNIVTSPHYKYLGDWMKATFVLYSSRQHHDSSD